MYVSVSYRTFLQYTYRVCPGSPLCLFTGPGCAVRVPSCVRVSRVCPVCPGSPGVFEPVPAPPGVFLPVMKPRRERAVGSHFHAFLQSFGFFNLFRVRVASDDDKLVWKASTRCSHGCHPPLYRTAG